MDKFEEREVFAFGTSQQYPTIFGAAREIG